MSEYLTNIPRIERDMALHELLMLIQEFWHSSDIEHRYWRNRARHAIREWRAHYERPERARFAAAVAGPKAQQPKAA